MAKNAKMKYRDALKKLILSNKDVTEFYRSIYDRCDHDKNGYISLNELKIFIATQEEYDIPENVMKCIYMKFDRDGDERLNFEEFLVMMNDPRFKRVFRRIKSTYLKFVVVPPMRQTIKLRRTLTNTGLYDQEYTCKMYTIGMVMISALQIFFFYINLRFQKEGQTIGPIERALRFDPARRYEVWRYLTHIFVHSEPAHLYSNLLVQILIGLPLEMVHSWRVLILYFAGAYGACLCHSVIDPLSPLRGASGGVYAFFTAHIAAIILNWSEMSHPLAHLLFFLIMTLFDPVYNYLMFKTMGRVSYIAHLGGAVVGLLLGVNILRNLNVTKNETIIKNICIIAYIGMTVVLVIMDVSMTLQKQNV